MPISGLNAYIITPNLGYSPSYLPLPCIAQPTPIRQLTSLRAECLPTRFPLEKYYGTGVTVSIPKERWEAITPDDLEKARPKQERCFQDVHLLAGSAPSALGAPPLTKPSLAGKL